MTSPQLKQVLDELELAAEHLDKTNDRHRFQRALAHIIDMAYPEHESKPVLAVFHD